MQAEGVDATAKDARELGARCEAASVDVCDEAQVRAGCEPRPSGFGRLDVLCNVAGILRFDHTHELALADWSR